MLGDLKSSPIEELRGRAASVEQGPVKLSVQTFGLLLTPTLAGLVPALSPALLHPAAHTCPDSTMMMYFWVSTAPLKCGYLLLLTPLRYAQSWRVERVWRMCQSVLQPLHYIQCEFERVCVCVWCSASHMHEQSWWFFHSRVFYWCWVAAARSYRGLCLPVTFVQPLNEIGCLGAIVIHANTFTSSSTPPPPWLSNYPACSWNGVPPSENDARGLSGTRCDFLACAVFPTLFVWYCCFPRLYI